MVYIGTAGLLDMNIEEYSNILNCVEINTTFYGIPQKHVWRKWKANILNENFIFSIKAPNYLSHKKKFTVDLDFKKVWKVFWKRCQILENNLGPILFQLPPYLKFTEKIMEKFKELKKFLPKWNYAFEFRNIDFYNDEMYDLFNKYKWTIVLAHINNKTQWIKNMPNKRKLYLTKEIFKSNIIYMRLHGFSGEYIGSYNKKFLNYLSEFIKKYKRKSIYIIFNNTDSGDALNNAIELSNMIGK